MGGKKERVRKRLQAACVEYKDDKEVIGINCTIKSGRETLRVFRVFEQQGSWEIRVDLLTVDGGLTVNEKNLLGFKFRTRSEAVAVVLDSNDGFSGETEVLLQSHI